MIKSYWLRILLCGIATAIVGFLIAAATPKQYDAVLQLLVAPYSPSMGQASDEVGESVKDILDASAPRTVTTQVETLTSIGVIQAAAEKVGNALNMPYRNPGDELNPFDLQDKITISAAKESDIVTLRVRMTEPSLARQLAGEMYTAFEDQNDRQSRDNATRAIAFLTEQKKGINSQVEAIEAASAKAKVDAGSANIEQEVIAQIQRLKELDTALDGAVADQEASQTRAQVLAEQMQGLPKTIHGSDQENENPAYASLTQQIDSAEADKAQLLERYTADSELVRAIQRRIDLLKSTKARTKQYFRSGSTETNNPVLLQMQQEHKNAISLASAAATRAAAIRRAVERTRADMAKLPAIQQKLNQLQRRQAVLERLSQLFDNKLQTLTVAQQGRRSATQLITPAVAIPRPAVPNYGLNVGLGLFLGLAIGFLWSIGTEAKRNPIRSLGQLNRLSLQPCYRVVPELRVPMRGLNRAPAEVFDSLLVNFVRSEKKGYRLGVLGVTKGAGATTTAMNLAVAAARGGYAVLYVEVDPGNNALTKLTPSAGDVKSPGANISIYNASLGETQTGATIGLPADLEVAAQGKDLVIFDFSPVKVSGDSFLLANQLDEMILLVRANVTKSVDFLQAQQALIDAGCPLVSVTLSRVQDQSDDVAALEQQAETRAITPQA